MSYEDQLLLLSARLTFDPETEQRFKNALTSSTSHELYHPKPKTKNPKLKTAPRALDWQYIQKTAQHLGISPLLHKHLSNPQCRDYVPTQVLESLQAAYKKQALRSLRIQAQIYQLLKKANELEIPIILLKGVCLAGLIYEDIALRPMSDIDILVRENDKKTAKDVLLALGYHQKNIFNSSLHEEVLTAKSHMAPFLKKAAVPIEVHTHYLNHALGGSAEMRNAWENAVPINLNGCSCYHLSNEDFLINLFEHLAEHLKSSGGPLYWFCDLHEMIQKHGTEIDWSRFHRKAEYLGLKPQISAICRLMEKQLGISVPELKNYGVAENKATNQLTAFENNVLLRNSKNKTELSDYLNNLKTAREIEGWGNRFYFLARYLVPSRENLISRYHIAQSWISPFFYVVHPFFLLKRAFTSGAYYARMGSKSRIPVGIQKRLRRVDDHQESGGNC